MKKICSFALISLIATNSLEALEFNEVGHKAMGMGGVGVALKSNPYAIFYNPALISANDATRMGYSIGVEAEHKNLFEAFNFDFNNIQNISYFNNLLKENFARVKMQGTWAFKAPDILPLGDVALGYSQSIYAVAGFSGQLPANVTNIGDNVDFHLRRLSVMELPLSYALSLDSTLGKLSWGAAVKFMRLSNVQTSRKLLTTDSKGDIQDDIIDTIKGSDARSDNNFGIDFGFSYSPAYTPDFTFALVGKNLNTPQFNFKNNGKLTIYPQARLGLAYDLSDHLSLAADADLTENLMLTPTGMPKQKSQKIGIGIDAHAMFFDARAGISKDLRQDNGAIVSFGMGFGFLDLGVAVATERAKVAGTNYPRYFSVQLGGSFEF
ncbi:conjugal transfer protein TraF [Campylobacter sp. MIT 97-5078]|uniref:conjugal transfer protein TraF n=1 Tax=Campylobacter sp. MIT 97-5078 TaxID=1548153 RepID=UPI000513D81B|nr:conjugal transfer protein TraF [Campylobacter sp. MIT 97-5078]KGI56081.1 hypothetical protein LR59_09050 [Campylobacter sp. MIT 97-5078]TQR27735.1 type IX secretion system membrane protein PorP/SprF [Campylobacter sp. MIT 97-5078]